MTQMGTAVHRPLDYLQFHRLVPSEVGRASQRLAPTSGQPLTRNPRHRPWSAQARGSGRRASREATRARGMV
jgi:hypothetical protein